ncbi:hypothetical protein [Pseudalkalibacillus salsuginis]|uniref:hypothetical protein n=1 Tax=Pseudalkalibacillus salsuginis TaxID=2910972 RepID=UPI001F19CF8E|nr:hypothetical protein [Pseudalkalibacillus salsuginis]MCF6410028.1 hypothetical protein [Pseudalkalibacillus salsuginis]
MDRKKWLSILLTLVVLFVGFGIQQVTYADADSNIGKFEYNDNSLQPTKTTGFPPKEKEKEDKGLFGQ